MSTAVKNNKAYVLLSGGQDSFVCLLWALERFHKVETIAINYNQRHRIEVDYAKRIAQLFDVKHTLYDLGGFMNSIADSSLLNHPDHNKQHVVARELPASFVPNRNGLFLTIVANHAFKHQARPIQIITGVCQTDYSGYPDCRDEYIKAKQQELSLGLDTPVSIHTPLMWKNKAQTFAMAHEYGRLQDLVEFTMTCYNGNENLNSWGRGCGDCPSCRLRKQGYEQFKQSQQ
jgi:7-cyano-7-deazaguanine synthase